MTPNHPLLHHFLVYLLHFVYFTEPSSSFVCRLSWRTAAERTSTSVRLGAAASSSPRCSVRFSKWASFVSLQQQQYTHTHTHLPYGSYYLQKKGLGECFTHTQAYSFVSNSTNMWTHIVTSPYVPSLLRWRQPSCTVIVLPGVHYLAMHLTPLSPFQHDIPPQGDSLCRERDAVPTSTPNWCALFICLYLFKCVSWSQCCSRLTPAAPCGEGDGIFSSVFKTMCPFPLLMSAFFFHKAFRLGCIAGFFTLVCKLHEEH